MIQQRAVSLDGEKAADIQKNVNPAGEILIQGWPETFLPGEIFIIR